MCHLNIMVEGKSRPIGSLQFPIHEVALKDVREIIAAEIGTHVDRFAAAAACHNHRRARRAVLFFLLLTSSLARHVGTFSSPYVFLSDGGKLQRFTDGAPTMRITRDKSRTLSKLVGTFRSFLEHWRRLHKPLMVLEPSVRFEKLLEVSRKCLGKLTSKSMSHHNLRLTCDFCSARR